MATSILGICCADKMIVGRWYKIISIPRYSYCISYKVTYQYSGTNIVPIHDTIYIKSTGSFTVTATDTDGNTATKTIECIEDPSPTRTEVEYTPSTWNDFKTKIEELGENKLIKIKKGSYDFILDETGITMPNGTIIDFNNSTINIYHEGTEAYHMFLFKNDHAGVVNAKIIGKKMFKDPNASGHCSTMSFDTGYNNRIENITFRDLPGMNVTMGGNGYADYFAYKPSHSSGRWLDSNNFAGYINPDNGELVASDNAWTMKDSIPVLQTNKNRYSVGTSAGWLNTGVKIYDIAFYDANDKFICIRENQQFYRQNILPDNAAKFRLCIHMKREAPKNTNPSDDVCFTRMRDGNNICCESLIRNIDYGNSACGGVSVAGQAQDIHFDNLKIPSNGWKWGWSFDFEDGWQAQLNTVISHSQIGGTIVDHCVQGLTILSSILTGDINFCDSTFYPTVINSYINTVSKNECRGVVTYINSYIAKTNASEKFKETELFEFGELPAKDRKDEIVSNLSKIGKWYINGDLSITKNLTNCKLSNTDDFITESSQYTSQVIPNTGYSIVRPTITSNGSDISGNYKNETITIQKVTGNLVINATAILNTNGPYKITYNLTNCKSSSNLTTTAKGSTYTSTLTPNDGYILKVAGYKVSKSITMGGVELPNNVVIKNDNEINIEDIIGDIVINCEAKKNYMDLTASYTVNKKDDGSDTGTATISADKKGITVTPNSSGGSIISYTITGLDSTKSYRLVTNMANFYDGSGPWVRVNPITDDKGTEDAGKGKSGRNSCGPITGYDKYSVKLYACNEKPVAYTEVYFGE